MTQPMPNVTNVIDNTHGATPQTNPNGTETHEIYPSINDLAPPEITEKYVPKSFS